MKADIFFFITSVAVVFVTVGVAIALYYIVRILRSIREVADRVDAGSKALADDMGELRSTIKREGFLWSHLFAFFKKHMRWLNGKPQGKRRS